MTKNILKTRFPSKFVGPQGQTSPLWPPPGRPNARGEGDRQEEKQDLAHRACASRAGEARARGNRSENGHMRSQHPDPPSRDCRRLVLGSQGPELQCSHRALEGPCQPRVPAALAAGARLEKASSGSVATAAAAAAAGEADMPTKQGRGERSKVS